MHTPEHPVVDPIYPIGREDHDLDPLLRVLTAANATLSPRRAARAIQQEMSCPRFKRFVFVGVGLTQRWHAIVGFYQHDVRTALDDFAAAMRQGEAAFVERFGQAPTSDQGVTVEDGTFYRVVQRPTLAVTALLVEMAAFHETLLEWCGHVLDVVQHVAVGDADVPPAPGFREERKWQSSVASRGKAALKDLVPDTQELLSRLRNRHVHEQFLRLAWDRAAGEPIVTWGYADWASHAGEYVRWSQVQTALANLARMIGAAELRMKELIAALVTSADSRRRAEREG